MLALSLAGNGATWLLYRQARAEADRAVAECNAAQLQTELDVATTQAANAAAALEAERQARDELETTITGIRTDLVDAQDELADQALANQEALRHARAQATDSCTNRPFDRGLWMQFEARARSRPASDPGDSSPGSGPGP